MNRRQVLAIAGAAFLANASVAGQAAADGPRARATCYFVLPASMSGGQAQWVGACAGGKADGLGMLRRRDGGQAGLAFYGEMRAGVPRIGVIDMDGGYRVGAFRNGDIGTGNLEWQEPLDAFNAAARAARAVSAIYRAQKNLPSARYYEDIAKRLEMQNDG